VQHLIEFAEARWFFVEDALLGNVDAVLGKMACVEQFVQFSVSGKAAPAGWLAFAELASGPADEPQVLVDNDDVATMFFTSGTESSPKGVLTSHANFCASHLAWALNFGLAQDDRLLMSLPLIHVAGYLFSTYALANQATMVMTGSASRCCLRRCMWRCCRAPTSARRIFAARPSWAPGPRRSPSR
jgi:fatty-acyl-CoA synthase